MIILDKMSVDQEREVLKKLRKNKVSQIQTGYNIK
jgi:hypothetical protein